VMEKAHDRGLREEERRIESANRERVSKSRVKGKVLTIKESSKQSSVLHSSLHLIVKVSESCQGPKQSKAKNTSQFSHSIAFDFVPTCSVALHSPFMLELAFSKAYPSW